GDEDLAVRRANGLLGKKTEDESIRSILPAVVKIISPIDYSSTSATEVTVEYSVRSPSGAPVRRVFAQIAQRPVLGAEDTDIVVNPDRETLGHLKIVLPPGDVTISLIAEGEESASEPANIRLLRIADSKNEIQPNLFALIAGVGQY